jgi:hypothetical protein
MYIRVWGFGLLSVWIEVTTDDGEVDHMPKQ